MLQRMVVVAYEEPPAVIAKKLATAAVSAGWVIEHSEEGPEPEGIRYRATFARNGKSLSTSTYDMNGVTIIQLMQMQQAPPAPPEEESAE